MYIEGTIKRLFFSTKFGCSGGCKYCYLSYLYDCNSVYDIDNYLSSKDRFEKGKNGTLLSIGCYTDPFLSENISDTLDLLKYLSQYNNYIQISTKFILSTEVIKQIINLRNYPSQISIYYSCPTISQDNIFEKNCPSAKERIENLIKTYNSGIPAILYIKPFIENVTKFDFNLYKLLLLKCNIPVVVGQCFTNKRTDIIAPIGNGSLNLIPSSNDYQCFLKNIGRYTSVFQNSTEVVDLLKKEEYNYE